MNQQDKIDYVEFPARDFPATKSFFRQVFGLKFEDSGPDYMAFNRQGVDGGFYRSEKSGSQQQGGALVIFYSSDLESTRQKVLDAGGRICKQIAHFPGGRRFHFLDPNDNELAVWSNFNADGSPCP